MSLGEALTDPVLSHVEIGEGWVACSIDLAKSVSS